MQLPKGFTPTPKYPPGTWYPPLGDVGGTHPMSKCDSCGETMQIVAMKGPNRYCRPCTRGEVA